jgi:hypothetical protein
MTISTFSEVFDGSGGNHQLRVTQNLIDIDAVSCPYGHSGNVRDESASLLSTSETTIKTFGISNSCKN